jgi:hypothetical protein
MGAYAPVLVALRAVVVGVVALGLLAPPAAAVLGGTNGRIAFVSGREGGDAQARAYLLPFTSSPGGRVVSPAVTPPGGQWRHPSWSPDRTKLVIANGTPGSPTTESFDLFIVDLVTPSITPITDTGDGLSADRPAWSPDGTRIAFERQTAAGSADRVIRVQRADDLQPPFDGFDLTAPGGPPEHKPAWSPDSLTLFYGSGDPNTVPNQAQSANILREPADNSGTPVLAVPDSGISEWQPSISPDGTQICFTLGTGINASTEVFAAPLADPANQRNISRDDNAGDYNCTWSPDGRRIAYVNGTFASGALVIQNADGTGFRETLTDAPGVFDGNPDWAPDGRPECEDRTVTTTQDTPVTIEVDCADTGPAYEHSPVRETVANDGLPANGTIEFPEEPPGDPTRFTYRPNAGFTGTDTIRYIGFDDFGFGTDRGTITVQVQPAPPGGGGPGGGNPIPPVLGPPPFPAKLAVARARVDRAGRRLDVLAPITARASGQVRVAFQAAGRTERFTAAVDPANRRVRFERALGADQARRGSGILTLTYPGDDDTQPQEVRLRAARRSSQLVARRPVIQRDRLTAEGRVSPLARGVVRLQLLFEPPGQSTRTLRFRAQIVDGRYRFDEQLPADVVTQIGLRRGVVHSYTLFTGFLPAGLRGEMASFQVLGER